MITGKVIDKNTGEPLAYANVYISDATGSPKGNIGTITDLTGKYSILQAEPGDFITASYVGYSRITTLAQAQVVNFGLISGTELSEVEIKASPLKKFPVAALLIIGLSALAIAVVRN